MPLDALLDDRKVTILKAIIKTYLETGEPVGSRTISKYSDLKLSSATIRNEMSDLEEMGYIIQPHTSAGRIPSDKGYRFYVDQIMLDKESEVTEFKEMMVQKVDKLELVLKKMAQVLAANTNYATMISGPSYHKTKLKFIQLSKMEKHKLLVVVVVEGNIIKNTMIDIADNLSDEELLNLNILLNSSLNGLTIEDINLDVISKLKGDAGIHSQVVDLVLNEVAVAIKAGKRTCRFIPAEPPTFSSTLSFRTATRPAGSLIHWNIKKCCRNLWRKSIPVQRKKQAFRFISVTRARCSP